MERHEWDVPAELLNTVTFQPSSLRSSENLPTTILSVYNEYLYVKSPRYYSNINQLRHEQDDW